MCAEEGESAALRWGDAGELRGPRMSVANRPIACGLGSTFASGRMSEEDWLPTFNLGSPNDVGCTKLAYVAVLGKRRVHLAT
jgi:hypothetical protein